MTGRKPKELSKAGTQLYNIQMKATSEQLLNP